MNRKTSVLFFTFLLPSPAPARDFDSRLPLKVFLREAGDVPDRVIGFTPARPGRAIPIPEGKLWYVRPIGELSGIQLDTLARAMKKAGVPGLDLSDHWELSNESLRHFASLTRLRMLDVSRTRISDAGMAELKPFAGLSILILPAGITDGAAESLRRMQTLRELGLDESRLTDRGLAQIARLPALEILDLSSTAVSDKGLAALEGCASLRRLTVGGLITDAGADALGKLKTLQEIDISQTQLGDKGLAALALLPKLRSATLGRGVTDRGLARLSASPSLKALDLSRTPVTDEGVKAVSRIKTLEELALSQTAIGDASLIALAQLSELRILDLSDTRVTPAGLAPLARLRKLEALSLSWQTLTQEDLQGMSRLKQVRTIVLNGVPIPEATMARLRRLSPWDNVADLGARPSKDSGRADPLAMALPYSPPVPGFKPGDMPGVRPAAEPASAVSPTVIPTAPDRQAASRVAFQNGERKATAPPNHPLPNSAPDFALASTRLEPMAAPAAISPGSDAASKGDADHLLQIIRLQSNPSRAGAFSGLSGMRQLRRTETLASLNRLATGASQPSVPLDDEDKPENSLGELSVGVVGQRGK